MGENASPLKKGKVSFHKKECAALFKVRGGARDGRGGEGRGEARRVRGEWVGHLGSHEWEMSRGERGVDLVRNGSVGACGLWRQGLQTKVKVQQESISEIAPSRPTWVRNRSGTANDDVRVLRSSIALHRRSVGSMKKWKSSVGKEGRVAPRGCEAGHMEPHWRRREG